MERKTDDLCTIILKIYYTLYTIKLKICTQRFYYSSYKFSKFIQGKWSAHLFVTHIQTEKINSWNDPTLHFAALLAHASTETFFSRIHIR